MMKNEVEEDVEKNKHKKIGRLCRPMESISDSLDTLSTTLRWTACYFQYQLICSLYFQLITTPK